MTYNVKCKMCCSEVAQCQLFLLVTKRQVKHMLAK